MIDLQSLSSKRFGTALTPALTVAAVGVLLAGCSPSAPSDAGAAMSSSSSSAEAMMMSSRSSADAMMSSSASSEVMSSKASDAAYKDGTYSADGAYRSPAGAESVHITLVLKGDQVTGVTFKGDATNQKSIAMQKAFGEGISEKVIGKSLDEVSVTVVNGASLTGTGFMDAVAKIKAEAKA